MRVSRMQAAENRETVGNVASSASSERHLAGRSQTILATCRDEGFACAKPSR